MSSSLRGNSNNEEKTSTVKFYKQLKINTAQTKETKEDDLDIDEVLSNFTQYETDPHRLEQRQKQIDLGKSKREYDIYSKNVPLSMRAHDLRHTIHPVTPVKNRITSKRGWDGLVRQWRRNLHNAALFIEYSRLASNMNYIPANNQNNTSAPAAPSYK